MPADAVTTERSSPGTCISAAHLTGDGLKTLVAFQAPHVSAKRVACNQSLSACAGVSLDDGDQPVRLRAWLAELQGVA
jgi:hypothetical protein